MEEVPLLYQFSEGGEGAEIVYALRNDSTLAQMALDNIGSAGQKMRKIYQRRLPENPSKDYYYIIRETEPLRSMLVEYGFIDNTNDSVKLKTNLNNYVEGVVKAIADYLGVTYTAPGTTSSDTEGLYIVKRGDTLYSIARANNTSVSEIKRLNGLTSDTLTVGQKLLLKGTVEPEVELITYTVKRGDSLSRLATLYNTDINTIKNLNNLTSNTIVIGQQLQLPKPEDYSDNVDYQTYIVQKGDSLWLIANRFNTTVDDIVSLNNLSSINLQIGDMLKIPNDGYDNNTNSYTTTYTVKSGDSLWSISKKYNISVDELKKANGLTSNLLSIGQQLNIPNN